MKKAILFFSLFLFSISHAQIWDWVTPSINSSPTSLGDPFGIAADSKGNVFQVGSINGTVKYGSFSLHTSVDDTYLAKFDSNGNVLWVDTASNLNSFRNYGYAVAADKAGNAYITGNFSDSVGFGPYHLTSPSFNNFFIVKYNSTGNIKWAKEAIANSATSRNMGNWITSDKAGNVYVTGLFTDTVTFGAYTLITGDENVFLVKYDSNGNVKWAKRANTPLQASGNGVATDSKGNIIVTGYFYTIITFGSHTLTSSKPGDPDVFAVKYDSAGNVIWAKGGKESNSMANNSSALTIDNSDNIYITGQFFDTLSFGAFILTTGNTYGDAFIAKYDSGGNVLWAKAAKVAKSGFPGNIGFSITAGKNEHIYVAGSFSDTITFDTIQLISKAFEPSFLYEFDSLGNALCGTYINNDNDDFNSVVANASGSAVYFGGDITGGSKAGFGTDTVVGKDIELAFLAKWQPCAPNTESVNEVQPSNNSTVLFPNPNKGEFTIQSSVLSGQSSVEIYNMLGEEIYSRQLTINSGQWTIDLRTKSSGVYLYRMISETGTQIANGKFLIE